MRTPRPRKNCKKFLWKILKKLFFIKACFLGSLTWFDAFAALLYFLEFLTFYGFWVLDWRSQRKNIEKMTFHKNTIFGTSSMIWRICYSFVFYHFLFFTDSWKMLKKIILKNELLLEPVWKVTYGKKTNLSQMRQNMSEISKIVFLWKFLFWNFPLIYSPVVRQLRRTKRKTFHRVTISWMSNMILRFVKNA